MSSFSKRYWIARRSIDRIVPIPLVYLAAVLALVCFASPITKIGIGELLRPGFFVSSFLLILTPLLLPVRLRLSSSSRWIAVGALLVGLAVALLGSPVMQVSGSLVILGSILSVFKGPSFSRQSSSCILTAGMVLVGYGVACLTTYLLARSEGAIPGVIADCLQLTINALQLDGFVSNGELSVTNGVESTTVLLGWDKFALVPITSMLGLLAYLALQFRSWRIITYGGLLTLIYGVIRGIWVVESVLSTATISWFDPAFIYKSLLPGIALLAFVPIVVRQFNRKQRIQSPPLSHAVLAAGLGAMVALLALGVPFYKRVPGTVVIDEHYSRWEWLNALDTTTYGTQTVYSYSEMARQLGRQHELLINSEPITRKTLENAAVLILKTPTTRYDDAARAAIIEFVEAGGSLWLIGDHTDIFGMNSYLNEIGSAFGVRLRADAVVDPVTNRQVFNATGASHSVLSNVESFLMYTGCSVDSSIGFHDVLLFDLSVRDRRNLAVNTFFGDMEAGREEYVGPSSIGVAANVGKGRIAVWADSTLFSNFSFYLPEKKELASQYVNWLRLRERFQLPAWLVIIVGFGVVLLLRRSLVFGLMLSGMVCYMTAIGIRAIEAGHVSKSLPTVASDVLFWSSVGNEVVPVTATEPGQPSPYFYLSAFVATERIGATPGVNGYRADDAFGDDDSVHVLCGGLYRNRGVTLENLRKFLEGGGVIVWLDAGQVPDSPLLESTIEADVLGLNEKRVTEVGMCMDSQGRRLGTQKQALILKRPDEALILSAAGEVVGGWYKVSNGWICILGTSNLFSDMSLGSESSVPNRRQADVYDLLYRVFESALAHRATNGVTPVSQK